MGKALLTEDCKIELEDGYTYTSATINNGVFNAPVINGSKVVVQPTVIINGITKGTLSCPLISGTLNGTSAEVKVNGFPACLDGDYMILLGVFTDSSTGATSSLPIKVVLSATQELVKGE